MTSTTYEIKAYNKSEAPDAFSQDNGLHVMQSTTDSRQIMMLIVSEYEGMGYCVTVRTQTSKTAA